jgi:hypothetical protein
MAGNLDLNETSTRLVQKALDSGEWQSVRDHTGREVYFNEVTRETTRDLRVLLLQRFEWAKTGSGLRGVAVEGQGTEDNSRRHRRDRDGQ